MSKLSDLTGAQLADAVARSIVDERKLYRIGRYTFVQKPIGQYSLADVEAAHKLIKSVGGERGMWADIFDSKVSDLFDAFFDQGLIWGLMDIALDFHDANILTRWLRRLRMKIRSETKITIIRSMTVEQAVEVVAGFFTMNFASMPASSDSLRKMESSLTDAEHP